MRLIKNFALTFLVGAILAVLAILVAPRTVSANHGVCPPSGWGINSGNSSHPAGLVLKTVDVSNNPINGITWRINNNSTSIAESDAYGNVYSHVSSHTFTTGETIWCGSPTDNYSGVTVLGFGSTRSYGNHWVLFCQKWDYSGPATYWIDNVASPAGRSGNWTGNPGNFTITNGGTTRITLTWHDAPLPPPPPPDLVITSLSVDSPTATYLPGQTVLVTITIRNQGGSTAGSFSTLYRIANFSSCTPESFQQRFATSSLAAGASQTLNGSFIIPTTTSPGTYTINSMVDVYCQITETNENNNRASRTYTVAAPAGPTCTISALPTSILAGEQSTLSWSASPTTTSAILAATTGDITTLQTINPSPQLPSGSQTVTPTVTTTYYLIVRDSYSQQGECGVTVTILEPSPSPSPPPPESPPPESPPPTPSPSPEIARIRPNPCLEPVATTKLTDNYITADNGDAPIVLDNVQATGTLGEEVTVPISATYTVDFSQLQSLFGYMNSDYLEGRFQDPDQKKVNLFGLKPAELNSYRGPIAKSTVKIVTDEMKRKYVNYVAAKPSLPESADAITDLAGNNPKTIAELVAEYGMPFPPQPGQDRSAWLATWGKYWEKISTSYNELYQGELEFAVVGGEEAYQRIQEGQACAAYVARTVNFNVPDFGRTTLVADVLNQTIVPYVAQSFRDHRTETQGIGQANPEKDKNVLGDILNFCRRIIVETPANLLKNLRKAVKTTFDFLTPIKPVFAQDADQNTCIKITYPGKQGVAPYCAVPRESLGPGDSCTNKVSENKLNKDNPNVVCTFVIQRVVVKIGDENFWDSCTANGDGTYTCNTKVRVYPNLRIPWLAEIWNSTLYSDTDEVFTPPVQGAKTEGGEVLPETTGVGSPQVTGRPGIYSFFIPKVIYQKFFEDRYAELNRLFAACPNFPSTDGGDVQACGELFTAVVYCLNKNLIGLALTPPQEIIDQMVKCVANQVNKSLSGEAAGTAEIKQRFIGATDCGKHYARDLALKPRALQRFLGITSQCPLVAAAVTEEPIGQPPSGDTTGLNYYIKYGNTSILPEDKAAIIALANNSWPDNNTDKWDYVVSESIRRGISPAFTIAIWWEEGGFGGLLNNGGRANSEFGCFPGGDTSQQLDFNTSFNCFLNFTASEHPYNPSDPYGSFREWVRYFCGPQAVPICSNNPGFIDRLESIYNSVVSGEIVYVSGQL